MSNTNIEDYRIAKGASWLGEKYVLILDTEADDYEKTVSVRDYLRTVYSPGKVPAAQLHYQRFLSRKISHWPWPSIIRFHQVPTKQTWQQLEDLKNKAIARKLRNRKPQSLGDIYLGRYSPLTKDQKEIWRITHFLSFLEGFEKLFPCIEYREERPDMQWAVEQCWCDYYDKREEFCYAKFGYWA